MYKIVPVALKTEAGIPYPVDTGRKLNVHKKFRILLGRLLNVLYVYFTSYVYWVMHFLHF